MNRNAPMLGSAERLLWEPRRYSEDTASWIDMAVRDLVDSTYRRARAVLHTNAPLLKRAAHELIERETLSGAQLEALASALVRSSAPVPALAAG